MMKRIFKKIFFAYILFAFCLFSNPVYAGNRQSDLKSIVDKYLAAQQATMLENSTVADIDKLLSFFTDDVVYEHPRVKMKIEGKSVMKEGRSRFLGATRDAKIVSSNQISNINVVVAEYQVTFKAQEGDVWKEVSRKQVTLFEFEGDKIKRLVDYW